MGKTARKFQMLQDVSAFWIVIEVFQKISIAQMWFYVKKKKINTWNQKIFSKVLYQHFCEGDGANPGSSRYRLENGKKNVRKNDFPFRIYSVKHLTNERRRRESFDRNFKNSKSCIFDVSS